MAGNHRSGRRPSEPPAATPAHLRPRMPMGMQVEDAAYWSELVKAGPHLSITDEDMIESVVTLRRLYLNAAQLAMSDPMDKDNRITVLQYHQRWFAALSQLCVDPIGRRRLKTKEPTEANPLDELGIVG